MQQFRPQFKRLFKRRENYTPVSIGDVAGTTTITVYINPFTDAAETFFDSVYDPLRQDYISDTEDVGVEFRPVAPEMSQALAATSADLQRYLFDDIDPDEQVSAGDFAEYLHGVRERACDDDFLYAARRASLVADPSILTYEKLAEFSEDFTEDVPGDALLEDVEKGTYRGRVRQDSTAWLDALPTAFIDDDTDPREMTVFVNGELVREIDPKTLRQTAESTKAFLRLDQGNLGDV